MAATGKLRGAALAALVSLGLAAAPANAQDGPELYELCAQCHGEAGEGSALYLAPNIAGLGSWYVVAQVIKFRDGLRGFHPDDTAGLRMHPMARAMKDDEDIRAVADYVESLPPVRTVPSVEGGDAARGAGFYAPCAACHGADGAGNEQLLAPPLRGISDWYLLSSLQRYKAGVRGANPGNANAQIMRGMAGTLPDEQAMRDVVAYINGLSRDGAE